MRKFLYTFLFVSSAAALVLACGQGGLGLTEPSSVGQLTSGTSVAAIQTAKDTCSGKKVRICHVPPGQPDNVHEICIASNARDAHIGHGDFDLVEYFGDADGDGYGAGAASAGCVVPEGSVQNDGDCDDGEATTNPGAEEVCGDDIDNDCDGDVDEDCGPVCPCFTAASLSQFYGEFLATTGCELATGAARTCLIRSDLNQESSFNDRCPGDVPFNLGHTIFEVGESSEGCGAQWSDDFQGWPLQNVAGSAAWGEAPYSDLSSDELNGLREACRVEMSAFLAAQDLCQ